MLLVYTSKPWLALNVVDNLLAELNQTSDDAEKEGIIGLVNATSEAIENGNFSSWLYIHTFSSLA